MSKAFTKGDDLGDAPPPPRPVALLPPGTRNYLTLRGAQQLRTELTRLVEVERAPLLTKPGDADAKHALQALDQRIKYLWESLRTAEILAAPNRRMR